MDRRSLIKRTGIAGVLAAGVAPAVHAQAAVRWRMALNSCSTCWMSSAWKPAASSSWSAAAAASGSSSRWRQQRAGRK